MQTPLVYLNGTVRHSLVDGSGVRFVYFFQGCPHDCPGCHNPETHDINAVSPISADEAFKLLSGEKYLDGVTFSGGDPFMQPKALLYLAKKARESGLNVWAYTGFTFEAILSGKAGEDAKTALSQIDVLADGPFVEALKDGEHIYRGSANQRLIDVKNSLKKGEIILYKE